MRRVLFVTAVILLLILFGYSLAVHPFNGIVVGLSFVALVVVAMRSGSK